MSKSPTVPDIGATAGSPRYRGASERIAGMLEAKLWWYYRGGEQLPTEMELAEYFQVSRPTVRKALVRVERAGLLRSRQGAGWYAAEELPRRTGRTVGVVCEDLSEPSPWFNGSRESRQLEGVRRRLGQHGYDVSIRLVNDRIREAAGSWANVRWADLLDFRSVCGLLVFWRFGHRRLHVLDTLREYAPLVAYGAGSAAGRGSASLEVASGVFESFRHLLCLGHERIAFLGSGPHPPYNQERHVAMRLVGRALPEHCEWGWHHFEPGSVTRAEGARLADAVLDASEPCTAAHIAARELGEGFYERLCERGLRVPEDFSLVVEIDDGAAFRALPADASRVEFDFEGLGEHSAELLMKIMSAPRSTHSVDPVSTRFVAGSTTADAPDASPVSRKFPSVGAGTR